MLNSIYAIPAAQLQALVNRDFPAYRGRQLLKWVYQKLVFDPEKMSDLPQDYKAWLLDAFDFGMPVILDKMSARDGSVKYLLELADGAKIEMVLIPEGKKRTLCVSSQTGCSRRCAFCATGAMGAGRNLYTHEILQQILLASQEIHPQRLTNIVFMGMGEPLDNIENLIDALRIIQDADGMAFSPRRITVSTCGVVPGIVRLADSGLRVKLALSLNSAIDATRDRLMPVNRIYPLATLKKALQYFKGKNPFRITFEYILIPQVNMDAASLKALRRFSGDIASKINFIPLNPVSGLDYAPPGKEELESFMAEAAALPQAITLRKSKGQEISGACGQLALRSTRKT